MSHPTTWSCRSCRTPLGRVDDGVLPPLVPVDSLDQQGVARVPRQGCRRVRVWLPDGVPLLDDARGPLEPGPLPSAARSWLP